MIVGLCDMDCFFASVEQRDDPRLVGKPVAVGSKESKRGVVATCSYEARKYGVRSAMPAGIAKSLCPELIFVQPNFEKYKKASDDVMSVLKQFTNLVEQVSIDEAYIDLTEASDDNIDVAIEIGERIRERIREITGLTATIGLSTNKFVAKVASSIKKPNSLNVVRSENVYDFISDLKISEFRGIGSKTEEIFIEKGIKNGFDLRNTSIEDLRGMVGEARANWFYAISRGVDSRKVETEKDPRKSIGLSKTYAKDIKTNRLGAIMLIDLATKLTNMMVAKEIKGKTINLKVRFSDFTTVTRSKTLPHYTNDVHVTLKTIFEFFENGKLTKPVRLFGISISNLDNDQKYDLW